MSGIRRTARSPGFTLVELLAAIALLSLMAAAIAGWAVAQRRAGLAAERRLAGLAAALTVARLVDADLALAVASPTGQRLRLQEDGALLVTTLARAPGSEPGAREVAWRFRAGALERVDGDGATAARVVSRRFARAAFARGQDGALVLEAEAADDAALRWRLPLRQGGGR